MSTTIAPGCQFVYTIDGTARLKSILAITHNGKTVTIPKGSTLCAWSAGENDDEGNGVIPHHDFYVDFDGATHWFAVRHPAMDELAPGFHLYTICRGKATSTIMEYLDKTRHVVCAPEAAGKSFSQLIDAFTMHEFDNSLEDMIERWGDRSSDRRATLRPSTVKDEVMRQIRDCFAAPIEMLMVLGDAPPDASTLEPNENCIWFPLPPIRWKWA